MKIAATQAIDAPPGGPSFPTFPAMPEARHGVP